MEIRLARLLEAATAARDHHTAALAQHRRAMAEIAARIAALQAEHAPTAPTAYTLSGAQDLRDALQRERIIALNRTLAAMRAEETGLLDRAALAVAKAQVAAQIAQSPTGS